MKKQFISSVLAGGDQFSSELDPLQDLRIENRSASDVSFFLPDSLAQTGDPNNNRPQTVQSDASLTVLAPSTSPSGAVGLDSTVNVSLPQSPTPGLTITWSGITQSQAGNWTPADSNVAAGTNNIITVVNDHIDIYDKTGTHLTGQSLEGFFGISVSNDVFDPRVMWDEFAAKFIVIADDQTGSNSDVHIAVSKDSNPADGWYTYDYNFKNGNSWIDYPVLGFDSANVYISGHYFDLTTGSYTGSSFWAINKSTLENGQGGTAYRYDPANLGASSSDPLYAPAHMYGTEVGLNGDFLVEYGQNNSGNDTLRVIRIENAGSGNPTYNLQSLNLGDISNAFLVGAPQAGTSTLLDDGDNRIQNAVWRDNKLYATTEIRIGTGSNAHDVVHWFVVDTSNLNNLVLLSQGNIDYGSGTATFYGNLTVDRFDNMIIGYSYSSSTVYASSAYAEITPGGTALQDSGFFLMQGQGTYTDSHGNRWGDYSGVAIDPSNDQSFWLFNQYATSGNSWATIIGGVQFDTTAPLLVSDNPLAVAVSGTATITANLLSVNDPDNTHAQLTYSVMTAPADGTLLKNGSATSTFTQDDIDNNRISYHENGQITSSDSFIFNVSDPANNHTAATQFQFQISDPGIQISTLPSLSGYSTLGTGDFNHDGYSDIVLQNNASGQMEVWYMGNGQIIGDYSYGNLSGYTLLGTGDFNGDGTYDMIWQNKSSGQMEVWYIGDGHIIGDYKYGNLTGYNLIGTGDFNHNGTSDMIWQNKSSGQMEIWYMNDGKVVGDVQYGNLSGYNLIGTSDLNHDGNTDLIWQNKSTGNVDVWFMGNGQRIADYDYGNLSGYKLLATGDINHDGTNDLLWQNKSTGEVSDWIIGPQTGRLTSAQSFGNQPLSFQEVASGLNPDGSPDVLWQDTSGHTQFWHILV